MNDLVGGHIYFMVTTIPSAIGLIQDKALNALAVTGEKRFESLPDVPTAIEADLPGYTASAWYGMVGPKGLPADVKAKLTAATAEILSAPSVLEKLKNDGATPSKVAAGAFVAGEGKSCRTGSGRVRSNCCFGGCRTAVYD